MKKERNRTINVRKNAIRLVIGLISFLIWILIFICAVNAQKGIISVAIVVIDGIAFAIVLLRIMVGIMDDDNKKSQQEAMETAKQMLNESHYVLVEYTGHNADLISLYAEALETFHCAMAAKLSEGKILYAIVNEDGNVVGRVDYKDSATFFINNFKKI